MSREERFNALDALAALLCLILLIIPLGYLVRSNPPIEILMIASVLIYPIAAVLAVVLFRRSLGALLSPGRFTAAQLLFAILGTAGITLILLSLLDPLRSYFPESEEALKKMDRDLRSVPEGLAWVLVAFLAPIGEEIFFRAALLRGFRSTLGTLFGILLSSGFFAFFHGIPPRMVVSFLVGLWLGSLYLAGRGLALSVAAHMFNNALVLAVGFAGVERIPLGWAPVGAAAFIAAALALSFSRQGSPPPATS